MLGVQGKPATSLQPGVDDPRVGTVGAHSSRDNFQCRLCEASYFPSPFVFLSADSL